VPQAFFVKGERPRTHAQLKKNIMKTNTNSDSGLQNRTAQRDERQPEFNKYIVLTWQGKEQVVSFPFKVKHADVFAYIRHEGGDVEAVSAGFFFDHAGAFWAGGESESMSLKSRPQDGELIQAFLQSPDRKQWDLMGFSAQAQEAASL
jgi:hypothetical protein